MILKVLAEHDEMEQMITVYLPASYTAIKAFNRFGFNMNDINGN